MPTFQPPTEDLIQDKIDIETYQPRPILRVTKNLPSEEMRKWLFSNFKK